MFEGVLWFVVGLAVQPFLKSKVVQQLQYQWGIWRGKREIEKKRPKKKMLDDGSVVNT